MADIFELFRQIEKKDSAQSIKPVSFIVAGLGNPGEKYIHTRHNMGFMCLDYISGKLGIKINKLKFKALCGEYEFGGQRVLFMKPQTFMNLSGEAVREAADFYKIPPENVLVIFDDISIQPGTMRVKRKGSDGGHNGIKSIIAELGSQNFPRIKIGVGSPLPGWDIIDWVLGNIPENRQKDVYSCIEASLPCAELIVNGKTDEAMNLYNRSFAAEEQNG